MLGFKAKIILTWLILILPILIVGASEKYGVDVTPWWVVLFSWLFVGVCVCLYAIWF